MKKLLPIITLAAGLMAGTQAKAQAGKWGVGLRLGSPTAFTVKHYIGTRNALDINLGSGPYAFYDNKYGRYRGLGVSLMINYLWRKPIQNARGLEFYYGLGGLISARSYYYDDAPRRNDYRTNVGLGATGAIGLEYFIPDTPISLFVELNPYVEIVPAPLYITLGGSIGGRFIF